MFVEYLPYPDEVTTQSSTIASRSWFFSQVKIDIVATEVVNIDKLTYFVVPLAHLGFHHLLRHAVMIAPHAVSAWSSDCHLQSTSRASDSTSRQQPDRMTSVVWLAVRISSVPLWETMCLVSIGKRILLWSSSAKIRKWCLVSNMNQIALVSDSVEKRPHRGELST